MDKIDIEIIDLLQKNARMSISEISSTVNLSISAISERLKKLETSNIIKQFTTIINPEFLNKNLTVIMFVSLERSQFTNKFLTFIALEDEILECHHLTGAYDYSLKIITNNTESLEQFMQRLKSIPGIRKLQTSVVLTTIKNNYSVKPTINDIKKSNLNELKRKPKY